MYIRVAYSCDCHATVCDCHVTVCDVVQVYFDSDVCSLLAAMVTRWLSVSSSQFTTCEMERGEKDGNLVRRGRMGRREG